MTAAFGAVGSKSAGGTTTVDVPHPASVGAGDLLVAGRNLWNAPSGAFSDESGWTPGGTLAGGTGTTADAHTTEVRADYKQAAGGETGNVTFDQTGPPGGCLGIMARYTRAAPGFWDVATATGDDATHGANRSITTSTNMELKPGDVVVVVVATDTDTSLTITAPAITASGITFGTTNRRTSGAGVTTGNDGNIEIFDAVVSSGSGTAAVTLAFTTVTSQCGPGSFLRLRQVLGGALTPATESDSAQTLGRVKSLTLAPATETDTPVALTGGLVGGGGIDVTLTPAAETDAAQTVGRSSSRVIGPAAESDTAPLVGRVSLRAATQSTETDSAVAPTRVKAKSLGVASETDSAAALGRVSSRTLAPGVEADTVPGAGRRKARSLFVAAETDSTLTVGRTKRRGVTQTLESETAVGVTTGKSDTLAIVSENDAATTLARVHRRTLIPATETDLAVTVVQQGTISRTLSVATETEAAASIQRAKTAGLSFATENDDAVAVGAGRLWLLTPAAESDAAVALVLVGHEPRDVTILRVIDRSTRVNLRDRSDEDDPPLADASARLTLTGVATSPALSEQRRPTSIREVP